jgi:hypothetical protein
MLKTPQLGPVIAMMLLAGATVSLAAPTVGAGASPRHHVAATSTGLNAWDGRRFAPDGIAAGDDDLGANVAGQAWDAGASGPDHFSADGARSAGDYGGASKLANLDSQAEAGALPLSQFEGTHAKAPQARGAAGVWDIVNRVRYGRLPEPASWALMLIGFGMIGAALRGFVVASRRLARLQPEDSE